MERLAEIRRIIEEERTVRIHFHGLGVDLLWENDAGRHWRPLHHHEADALIHPEFKRWSMVRGFGGECCYWRQ